MTTYLMAAPNPFKHIKGKSIRTTIVAKDKRKAVDKFYVWLADNFNGYDPEVVTFKAIDH